MYSVLSCTLDKMQHISLAEFKLINWLPIKERVHQCIFSGILSDIYCSCNIVMP